MKIGIFLIGFFLNLCILVNAADQAVLVHNTLKDIDACKGKVKLKLVRTWGGDKEQDENKFFTNPTSVVVSQNRQVHICDMHGHCIKVFDDSGKYLRTTSEKGRGPGDTLMPGAIALSPDGDLVVFERGGYRIQYFSPEGKSKKIIKFKHAFSWGGVTSKNELIAYDHFNTFHSRTLISVIDNNGKKIRDIGAYHDKSKNITGSDRLLFAIDNNDNVYAANVWAPVIRKYSPDGRMLMAITITPPFEIPFEITLNAGGDEINKIETSENPLAINVKKNKRGTTIQSVRKKGKPRNLVFSAIATDLEKRIYAVTRRRLLTDKEALGTGVAMSRDWINRERLDFDIVENIDVCRLLVFSPNGIVIAEAQLTTFCDGIYITGNRLFIVDGFYNQRLLEYLVSFEEEG